MTELLIIADDLTGAIDTGVQLAKQGIKTQVVLEPDCDYQMLFHNNDIPVLVVNTESRHIESLVAANRIHVIMEAARIEGIKRFYKKTDSTLRGNIGKELEALKKSIDQKCLPFIPAHPKLKRFTRDGHHFIDDIPLQETAFGKDPLEPVTESHIPNLLRNQTDLTTGNIKLDNTEQFPMVDILIFDCESIEELQSIVKYLFANNCARAIAGSAAMVELLPDILGLKKDNPIIPSLKSPILLINGSLNEISRNQIKFASVAGIKSYTIPEKWLIGENFLGEPLFSELISGIEKAFAKGDNVIISTSAIEDFKVQPEYSRGRIYGLIAQNTGIIIHSIMQKIPLSGLVVFGGDTLMGVMQALGCRYIEPKLEIEPGVALSLTVVNEETLYMITKPGGYGDEDVIIKIFNYIKKEVE